MSLQDLKIEMILGCEKKITALILRMETHITEHETTYKLQKKFYALLGGLAAFVLIVTTIINLILMISNR